MKRFLCLFALTAFLAPSFATAASSPRKMELQTARTSPYSLVGQLFFESGRQEYIGSGVVIKGSSVLTAAHNLYDPDNGWSTNVEFNRGAYGTGSLSSQYSSRIYLLAKYQARANYHGPESVRTFAADTGGLAFSNVVAEGASAGWTTDNALLTRSAVWKAAVGYGAEAPNTGDYPLTVTPTLPFYRTHNSFFENDSIYVEGGMSGGPVFARDSSGRTVVTGVIVSASDRPYVSTGIRILNRAVADLIRSYLR